MLKIFISHASADTDIAVALQGWIDTTFLGGVSVFVSSDGRSISPGDDWRGKIKEALREADIALVICTESSLARPWLSFEAGAAWMRGAKVVPLYYHGLSVESLPLPLSSRQALDLGRLEDMNALLALFIREGGFDVSLVERKQLSLPPRRVLSTSSQPPDVRATAEFAWLGARTRDLARAFKEPRPTFIFRVENHGTIPVYRFLATFGEAGAAQNAAPLPQGERHLSHLAMNSPSTLLTVCRGDTRPVPCQRHRDAHH
jgi:TIR domain